jgi:hypothetical protein
MKIPFLSRLLEIKEEQLYLERIQTIYIQGISVYLTKLQRRKKINGKQNSKRNS